MRIARALTAGLVMIGLLTACSPAQEAPAEPTPDKTTAAAETASQAEVVAVIADYIPGWREVIADASTCRELWASPQDTDAEALNGYACFLKERTLGLNAATVLQEWDGMTPPEDMEYDVDDLSSVLAAITTPDLTDACGDDLAPVYVNECKRVLGNLPAFYKLLGTKLDRWEKYL